MEMDVLSTEIKTGAKEEYVQTTCLVKLPYFHGEISVVDLDLDSKSHGSMSIRTHNTAK